MKTRLIAALTALGLVAALASTARADTSAGTLAWQEPGYVMEVVMVSAPRSATVPAYAEPGYVMEVVVVTASRGEAIARAREAAREAALMRQELLGDEVLNVVGAPAR